MVGGAFVGATVVTAAAVVTSVVARAEIEKKHGNLSNINTSILFKEDAK